MAREGAVLAVSILALATLLPLALAPPGLAGDVDSPEMTDTSGDSVSGREARDLIAGWLGNETNSSFDLSLQASALEPFTPYADWQNLPVVYYEFFFDVSTPAGTDSYMARATIPMHGPFAAFSSFELLSVNYTEQGAVAGESPIDTINGRYIVNAATVLFTVDKPLVRDPARGDLVSGIWGRIRSASSRSTGDAVTEDTMMSHLNPGEPFPITGGETFYRIILSSTDTYSNATADEPATFEINIRSESEKTADVTLRTTTTVPANWTFETNRPIYTVEPGQNVTAVVTITPDVNSSNVTRVITVAGRYITDQNQTRATEGAVALSVTVPDLAGPGGGGLQGSQQDALGMWVAAGVGVGALAAAGLVFFLVLPKRRARRAAERFAKLRQARSWSSPRSGPPGGPVPRPLPRAGPAGPFPRGPMRPQPARPMPSRPNVPPGPPRRR